MLNNSYQNFFRGLLFLFFISAISLDLVFFQIGQVNTVSLTVVIMTKCGRFSPSSTCGRMVCRVKLLVDICFRSVIFRRIFSGLWVTLKYYYLLESNLYKSHYSYSLHLWLTAMNNRLTAKGECLRELDSYSLYFKNSK